MTSKKPSKQRRKIYESTIVDKKKLLRANVDKPLRESTKTKSLLIRTGDKVKVMRGKHKGFEGKVKSVSHKAMTVEIDGLKRKKVSGQEIPVFVHPSNLKIIELESKDPKRF